MFRSLIIGFVLLGIAACGSSHRPPTNTELSFSEALAPYCARITDPLVLRRSCNVFLVERNSATLITGVDSDGITPRVVFLDSSYRAFRADYFRPIAEVYDSRTMRFVGPRDADYNTVAGHFLASTLS